MSVPEGIRQLKCLQRLSLDHNPLDDKLLAQIRKEGALSVIAKDVATLNKECKQKIILTFLKFQRNFAHIRNNTGPELILLI
jgi:hypothetical protein